MGVVLSTVNWGWPGGTFIAYRLTDGPAAGLVVYAAEDIEPRVQIGEERDVPTPSSERVYEGSDGIETGWSGRRRHRLDDGGQLRPVLRRQLDRVRVQLLSPVVRPSVRRADSYKGQ